MKRGSTHFLRAAVMVIGLAVLVLCIFALPPGWQAKGAEHFRPLIGGMYAAAIPFYIALYQVLKLLGYVDKNTAFSGASVRALGRIKYCGFVVSGLYALVTPMFYELSKLEDAPGVMILGLILTFAPLIVAVFAAVLQKLIQSAIDIKSENDLTV